jgi:hypothetical protein
LRGAVVLTLGRTVLSLRRTILTLRGAVLSLGRAVRRLGVLRVATAATTAVVILSRHCDRRIELLLMMRL